MSWADWRVLSGNMGKDADGKFGWGTVAKDWCTRDDPPGIFGDSEDESSSAKTAKEKYQDVSNTSQSFTFSFIRAALQRPDVRLRNLLLP